MPEYVSRRYVFLLIACAAFFASLFFTSSKVYAIETDCNSQTGVCRSEGIFCGGSLTPPCQATCSAGNRNGVPYCNAANTACIYPCSASGSGSGTPRESGTWIRVFTVNQDGNNYWGPESENGVLGGATGPNRIDDTVTVTPRLDSDSSQNARLSPWAIWSDKFCGRAAPRTVNAQGDLTNYSTTSTDYCVVDSRNNGTPQQRTWCKADIYNAASTPFGGGGCADSPWFVSIWPPTAYESPNNDYGDHHNGNYYLLDEIDGMIEYLRNTSSVPTPYKYQNFDTRFTFNIVSRSEYPLRVNVTPPASYFCDHAYYARNLQNGRSIGNLTPSFVDPATGQCSFDNTVESNGNFLFVDVKKAVLGRVVGVNYANSTSVGLPNITVRLRAGTSPSSSPSVTLTDTTDSNGYYEFKNATLGSTYPYYTVDVTSAAPTGYVGTGYAIRWNSPYLATGQNIAYSWRMVGVGSTAPLNAAGDTKVGDAAYHNQTLSAIPTNRDCSSGIPGENYPGGRCWFGYRLNQPVTQPAIQAIPACLVPTGNETIRWTPSTDADAGTTITYTLRIYDSPSGCTGVGTQTLSGCTGALLHAPAAIANTVTAGYVNYSGYNFAAVDAYQILLQANSSDGSRSNWVSYTYTSTDKPTVTLSTPTNLNNGSARASWTHSRGTSFSVTEDSVAVGSSTATTSPQTLDIAGACDGVAHAYRVRATNSCGFTDSNIVNNTCATATPTCGALQWNNGGVWTNYSTAQSMNPGTTRQFRVASASGGVAPLSYAWTNTCTPAPSPANPATPTTATTFTAPSTGGSSCGLTFRATSSGSVPTSCSVSGTISTPTTCGTTTMTGLTLSKASRTGTVTHTVTGLSGSGAGTATIQTTAGTICDPAIGTCTWATNGNVPLGTSSRTINVTLKNNNYGIRAGGLFQLRVGFTAPGCTARTDTGTVTVSDALPQCTAVTFATNPYKFPGAATLNTTYTLTDDFSVKDFGVQLFYPDVNVSSPSADDLYKWSPAANGSVSTDALTLRATITDAADSRSFVAAWTETAGSAAALPSGRYYARAYISDWYGHYASPYNSERYRWCTPAAGYDPLITIDSEAPTCNLVAFSPTSPSATSPVTISATATDNWTQLRTARFLVYATGADRDATPAPTPLLDQTQSFTVNAATATTRTQSWNTSTLPRGSYDVYVDWTDQMGNRTNTTEFNQCVGTFEIPSYFRTTVEYPKDPILESGHYNTQYGTAVYESNAVDGSTVFEFQSRKNGAAWLAEASSGSWVGSVLPNCAPGYPDTTPSTQHDTSTAPCDAYYRSAATYNDSDTANIRIKLPYVNKPKYAKCTVRIYNDANPSAPPIEPDTVIETGPTGYQYCRPVDDFNVLQGSTSSGAVANMYPTRVEFQLDYATDRIVGRVQGPDPTNPNVFMFSPPYVSGVSTTDFSPAPSMSVFGGTAYYTIPAGGNYSYAENYWAKASTASVNINRNTSHANTNLAQECYYLYDGTNARGAAAVGDTATIQSWFTAGEMTRGTSIVGGSTCNISGLAIPGYDDTGFTPSTQAKLYTIVGPRIAVQSSTVTLVNDVASCSGAGQSPSAFPGVSDITMRLNGGTVDVTAPVTSSTGAFTFETTPLDLNENYTLAISEIREGSTVLDLSNFGFCGGSNGETLDISALLPNYPLGTEQGVISRDIKIFKKDTNSWFQVYNGGVHTNEELRVNSNEGSAQGMPVNGVLVGNPGSDSTTPTGFNIYGNLLQTTCTNCALGGLVSSFGLSSTDSSFNNFGLVDKNWGVVNFSMDDQAVTFPKPIAAQFTTVAAAAGSTPATWTTANSTSNAINHPTSLKTYYNGAFNETIIGAINLGAGRRVAFINLQNGTGTLNLYGNIDSVDLTRGLLLYVHGNVFIGPSVTELDGVSIIASGNITLGSQGVNLDNPINIRGALYSDKQIYFERNLNETNPAYIDSPAARILFDPSIISQSSTQPAEITVSNVYYEVQD